MEQPIRIFILDASEDFSLLLRRGLERCPDLTVSGFCANGAEACALLRAEHPDVLVTDLLLPGLDGLSLLRCLKHEGILPKTVVVSGFYTDRSAEALSRLGVACYLAKPCSAESLIARIREAAELQPGASARSWEPLIREALQAFGVPAHLDGHRYLVAAIRLAMEDRELLRGVTKVLYPTLARRFGTSASCVERSIRAAVLRGWESGAPQRRRERFGARFEDRDGPPGNARFIAAMADYLQSGYDAPGNGARPGAEI